MVVVVCRVEWGCVSSRGLAGLEGIRQKNIDDPIQPDVGLLLELLHPLVKEPDLLPQEDHPKQALNMPG